MNESEHLEIRGLNSGHIWDYENGFHWFSSPLRLAKLIGHYELYRRTVNFPGSVAEFGVYKGNSLIQLATFRNMLEFPQSRKIYAFDIFGEFPKENVKNKNDLKFIERFSAEGGDGL